MSSESSQNVSDPVMGSLIAEVIQYCMKSCLEQQASLQQQPPSSQLRRRSTFVVPQIQQDPMSPDSTTMEDDTNAQDTSVRSSSNNNNMTLDQEEFKTVAAEMAAAKIERIGYSVGYRWTERLAQTKTWNSLLSQDAAAQTAAQQLEAVKFLCKEVWVVLFGKQIDKLQTNHRGVFVLKDLDLPWLQAFHEESELARVHAIQLLAFPCGVIRGALADLGIPAVVSCDFMADGQNLSACSFNIKVK